MEVLENNWQVVLIASLPGSALRVWGVLSAGAAHGASPLAQLAAWSTEHGLLTLLAMPALAIAGLLLHDAGRAYLPRLPLVVPPPAPPPLKAVRLDAMTAPARELLAAVSPRGEFRLVPRTAGAVVVVAGLAPGDDREFYDPANRDVTQRYRQALAELERAGLIERDGEARRLSSLGWPAARLLSRQELDRLALRARHLSDAEQRLLRLIADCRQRYRVEKVLLRRDGSAVSVVYGNGQIVSVPDVSPRAETLPDPDTPDAAARFAALVTGMPEEYLVALAERRPGNPFVLRLTETGLRYLRCADIAWAAAA
jgi:hypothetical protein